MAKHMAMRFFTQHVHGDEAGTGGGVKSGTHGGICEPIGHAKAVNAEKSAVIRHLDQFWMNNRNTVGEAQFSEDMAHYEPSHDDDPIKGSLRRVQVASNDPDSIIQAAMQLEARESSQTFAFFRGPVEIPPGILTPRRPLVWPLPPVRPLPPGLAPRPPVPMPPLAPKPGEVGPKPEPGPQPTPPPGPEPKSDESTRIDGKCNFKKICFYPDSRLHQKEYQNQLQMQEDVLNGKSPGGYLGDRNNFETNKAAVTAAGAKAQKEFWIADRDSRLPPLQQQYGTVGGLLAYEKSVYGQAALHRLDKVEGGDPTDIARAGGGAENSQIGATMRQRTDAMDEHARQLAANKCPKMRVKLTICGTKQDKEKYDQDLKYYQRNLKEYEEQLREWERSNTA